MTPKLVPDSEYTGVIALLPVKLRAFLLLARLDRPIGWWLLFWPCIFGLALSGGLIARWDLALWMLLGAIVMRGAGCVYNDIVDRDLDAQVARTASRPLPSGDIGLRGAWAFLLGLCAFGLLVLASPDAQRFNSQMGTDLLERLAELAGAALSVLQKPQA